MAVDHVKSTAITNLDTVPPIPNTAGKGGAGLLVQIDGWATAVAASSVDATYQLVRVPSYAKVKEILFQSEAQGAGAFDIGVYYATDGAYGRPTALLAAAAIDQDLFATAIDCASAVARTNVTNESGTYTFAKQAQALWEALGLTEDPRGYFDIVATVKTTAVTTGTGKFGIDVRYTE